LLLRKLYARSAGIIMWANSVIEVLTGVFCGILSGLIAGAFGYVRSGGKRFDVWVLVVGAVFGVVWVVLNANAFFTWQEWFWTVIVLVLFEYGGKAVWRRFDVQVKIDWERVFVFALNVGTIIYIVFFLVALFSWFLPFVFSGKFMIYEWERDALVFRWFARSVVQSERDAFVSYIVFGFPLMVVCSYHALASLVRRKKTVTEDEDWEHEKPEILRGRKINREIMVIEEHALNCGASVPAVAVFCPSCGAEGYRTV
jgi:hypothetical protein